MLAVQVHDNQAGNKNGVAFVMFCKDESGGAAIGVNPDNTRPPSGFLKAYGSSSSSALSGTDWHRNGFDDAKWGHVCQAIDCSKDLWMTWANMFTPTGARGIWVMPNGDPAKHQFYRFRLDAVFDVATATSATTRGTTVAAMTTIVQTTATTAARTTRVVASTAVAATATAAITTATTNAATTQQGDKVKNARPASSVACGGSTVACPEEKGASKLGGGNVVGMDSKNKTTTSSPVPSKNAGDNSVNWSVWIIIIMIVGGVVFCCCCWPIKLGECKKCKKEPLTEADVAARAEAPVLAGAAEYSNPIFKRTASPPSFTVMDSAYDNGAASSSGQSIMLNDDYSGHSMSGLASSRTTGQHTWSFGDTTPQLYADSTELTASFKLNPQVDHAYCDSNEFIASFKGRRLSREEPRGNGGSVTSRATNLSDYEYGDSLVAARLSSAQSSAYEYGTAVAAHTAAGARANQTNLSPGALGGHAGEYETTLAEQGGGGTHDALPTADVGWDAAARRPSHENASYEGIDYAGVGLQQGSAEYDTLPDAEVQTGGHRKASYLEPVSTLRKASYLEPVSTLRKASYLEPVSMLGTAGAGDHECYNEYDTLPDAAAEPSDDVFPSDDERVPGGTNATDMHAGFGDMAGLDV